MKKWKAMALILCSGCILSACASGGDQPAQPAVEPEVVAPQEQMDASIDEEAPVEEAESVSTLPEMEPEYQEYADKYLAPAQLTLLRYDFGLFDYANLMDDGWSTFAMIAEDFYRAYDDSPYREASYFEYWENGEGGFPQDFFEQAIQQYLPVASEDLRTVFGDRYVEQEGRYFYEDGRGGPAYTIAVVTGASRGSEDLVLDYDLYTVLPEDIYEYTLSGQIVIEIHGDQFTYVSNTIA